MPSEVLIDAPLTDRGVSHNKSQLRTFVERKLDAISKILIESRIIP